MKKQIAGRILAAVLSLVSALALFTGCGEKPENKTLDGAFTISSASLNGRNVTDSFQTYRAAFSPDGTMRVTIVYLTELTTRNSVYAFDGERVTETYRGEQYVYFYSEDTLTTQFLDFEDVISVVLTKEREETGPVAVDFEGVLFGTDMSDSKFYNYCPAILRETENGEEVMHVWYCTNRDDGVMMDYIGYRKGVMQEDGKWLFGEQQIVLSPTEGTWDARHTCDPAVIRGSFRFRGTEYRYLMAYLGCTTEDYQKNETGIAVSNSPEGPWVKVDSLNPIVPWYDNGDYETELAKYAAMQGTGSIYWGTGMPALVSLDGEGDVLMFNQSTLNGTTVRRWDFSDLDNLSLTAEFTVSLSHNGIVNSNGGKCNIGIPDFAYDPTAKRFYVCGVTNEKNPADETTTRVNSHSMVAYLENVESTEALCEILRNSGGYQWKMLGYVGPDVTGFERNHNPGIVRDAYGYVNAASKIDVVVSTGRNSWENENIFTYRLRGVTLNVS
ncbi:MAG: hypothetical protein ACI4ST_02900 [Candidatus Gallimonas sp.]